jgi:CRISPR/Cas system endoribonuclease Cas6 (RAMP superfamily)
MSFESSYIIPKSELTLTDMKQFRQRAVNAGLNRCAEKLSVSTDELMVRHVQNILDFGSAAEQWNTAALAAVGTAYSVFQAVPAPTMANNKLAVLYKIGCETIPVPISQVTIRSGGAAGNIKAEYDFEQVVNAQELEGYVSEPVPFDPTETFAIQVLARIATGALARVQLGMYLFEPKGQRVASM